MPEAGGSLARLKKTTTLLILAGHPNSETWPSEWNNPAVYFSRVDIGFIV